MQITETEYQEIKQRLVHIVEELKELKNYYPVPHYENEIAYLHGRECELNWFIDLLNSAKERENKNGNSDSQNKNNYNTQWI